jgi:serine/threonine protein kinase
MLSNANNSLQAIHLPTKDIVALKIIKIEEDEDVEKMLAEVKIMKLCSHPNIVKFYGAWLKDDELFVRLKFLCSLFAHRLQIAMELCGGGSVQDLYQGMILIVLKTTFLTYATDYVLKSFASP